VDTANSTPDDPRADFITASVWHGSLDDARAILAAHPGIASRDIHTAALLGDDAAVRRFLALDPGDATAKAGPLGWDALTHLCFSKYLRLEPERSAGFVRAAEALLDAGASANTGYFDPDHRPHPQFESVLYGAAGVAHHAGLTRLLLERGADPNDGEVAYHAPETGDNEALKVLVESGKLSEESLTTILLRKADWHDYEAIKWLLEQGVDPNSLSHWGKTALHNAVLSDNQLAIFEVLLDHGADPTIPGQRPDVFRTAAGKSAVALAARAGRGDVLALFESRGIPIALEGLDGLLAACARNDAAAVRALAASQPGLVRELLAEGGVFLARFAGTGNTEGVRQLLDVGVEVAARFPEGDGYFGIARDSTALHVAAWRARPETVKLLIARGAPVDALDGEGRTPLALAVRACVDSWWTERRSPGSVQALLAAGASVRSVPYPSGYAAVDELLKAHGSEQTKGSGA
jgi:ankyrin repeat protein